MIVRQTQWPPLQTQWRKNFYKAQEAPSDHGDGACPFFFLKIHLEPLRMPLMMTQLLLWFLHMATLQQLLAIPQA